MSRTPRPDSSHAYPPSAPADAETFASPANRPESSGPTRREFVAAAAAGAALFLAPRRALAQAHPQALIIHLEDEIGEVRPAFHGQFAEHLGSCTYGGLWVGKDSRIPNEEGYRKAALEYLRALGVPVLRWPGGCYADDYHWRNGVGPQAERPHTVNIWWGDYVENNSFGTDEYIGLCRRIGAEPYIAGNVGSGSPEEMRDWLEYCNYPSSGPAGSTLAYERAKNGSPEPFRVRYWGIGNESWGCGGQMEPEEYALLYRRFANFMRPMGDITPYLVASGPNGDDPRWMRGLMDGLGTIRPGGVSLHDYSPSGEAATDFTLSEMDQQLATFAGVEAAIERQRAILDGYDGGRAVGLILDEWGVWDRAPWLVTKLAPKPAPAASKNYGALWQQATMRTGLAAGLGLNIFNRQADKLYMCNIAQIMNVLQSLLLTNGPEGEDCVRTTTYYVFELFKPHRGNTAVRVAGGRPASLGVSASASYAGKRLVVSLVNPTPDPVEAQLPVRGAAVAEAQANRLQNDDINAANTFAAPFTITPRPAPVTVANAGLRLTLPRFSVTTILARLA